MCGQLWVVGGVLLGVEDEGVEDAGVDDDGVVVVVLDAALAIALLSPKPTPTAAPDTPMVKSTFANRFLMAVISFVSSARDNSN